MFVGARIIAVVGATSASPEAEVVRIFEESCTLCHDSSGDAETAEGLDLEVAPVELVGKVSVVTGKPLVVPGDPDASYLLHKIVGAPGMAGDLMPLDEEPLAAGQVDAVAAWIRGLDAAPAKPSPAKPSPSTPAGRRSGSARATTARDSGEPTSGRPSAARSIGLNPSPPTRTRTRAPFLGTNFNLLPTTTTVRTRSLQFRIDHRFGRVGTERGAFGLDAGVVMSLGLAYGILDGWDVRLRRSNSRKDWELATVYVPVRQEDGMPVSFGAMASVEYLRDFEVANAWTGNLMLMLGRLWFDRWGTLFTVGYHFDTNHDPRVYVEWDDEGRVLVQDRRDTLTLGVASTVRLGRRKRWGIDAEYVLPVPDGRNPNLFYYRGGDADASGMKPIGSWTVGGSLKTGLHFFQVFLTNNREIHTNLAAAGGHSDNPFATPGVDSKNPFHKFNFFIGFNLSRRFDL